MHFFKANAFLCLWADAYGVVLQGREEGRTRGADGMRDDQSEAWNSSG
jgi:hypothetical protein